jgi:hypothetical protein
MRTSHVQPRTTVKAFVALGMMIGLGLFGVASATVATTASAVSAVTQPKLVAYPHTTKVPKAVAIPARGSFDCNGDSPVEAPVHNFACTDIRGLPGVDNANTWSGRFYDNGVYIGHDEPDITFLSSQPGSGNNASWDETLPIDPAAAPTVGDPGKDIDHYFELSPAPWWSMAMCDPYSYPQLPCTPESDSNAPSCNLSFSCPANAYPGGGSAFMEMQLYPPGNPPWVDSESCSTTQWCAALTIDSLECTVLYATCQDNCEEPINFAFIQTNGTPTGPAGPGDSDFDTSVNNSDTLLMNPGDKLVIHMYDAPAPAVKGALGGNDAFEVVIDDLTTGASGFMQASAANGFQFVDMNCNTALANFQPEYSTASVGNVVPWGADQVDVSEAIETGHMEICTSVSGSYTKSPRYGNPFDPDDTGGTYDTCNGGDETEEGNEGAETADGVCYAANDPHTGWDNGTGTITGPAIATCQADYPQNGDLDFDGNPYRDGEWPVGSTPTSQVPSSFVESLPTFSGGNSYSRFFLQTDIALSESTCKMSSSGVVSGCAVPPAGSEVAQSPPVAFYPYYSLVKSGSTCSIEFGNVTGTGVADFGAETEYGTDQFTTLGYPQFMSNIYDNNCTSDLSQGYYMVGTGGQVVTAGDAATLPSVHGQQGNIVGVAATPDGKGYFAVSNTGAVYTAGDAVFHGDLTSLTPAVKVTNIVAIAPTTDGGGYWLIGADGGEFAFGDAKYHGSLPGIGVHVSNIVGMVATPGGAGYLIVGSDGGVFAFGRTHFFGSLPGIGVKVNDIRGILPAAAGTGYILVGADGGAFNFGHGAPFHGSLPGEGITVNDIVGIALTSDDGGYWMAGSNGTVYPFGDAQSLKSNFSSSDTPISGIAGATTDLVNN